ncbi:hypothetical protein SAMN04487945_2580 [Halobacterium jilantaiense]|uniref:Ig-like domain-containing protein n=2 Tax=Halobacterium jilantaiense TaxID=355548 RepID=A0A1I0QHD4_9EURY|nr:hypothetical protein SAMN04487945_2580 [Halobacterium jilantaiense]
MLAGCSSILSETNPDVVVFNQTGESVEVTIEVTDRSTGETVLSDTATIEPSQASEYPDALPDSGDFSATVQTAGELSGQHAWAVTSEDQSLQVRVQNDTVEFDTVTP